MFNPRRGIMKLNKDCENCGKYFEYNPSRRPKARFCSGSCLSKKTGHEKQERRQAKWDSDSEDETFQALINRFEKFVVKKNGCWEWNGCINSKYGAFRFRKKPQKAHRVSWVIHNGEIPDGLQVLHKCDNPPCTNPEHLFLGTNADNMKDMVSKKRHVSGKRKLTKEMIIHIRNLLKMGVPSARLSRDYKVSETCIYNIRHNISWKNIE